MVALNGFDLGRTRWSYPTKTWESANGGDLDGLGVRGSGAVRGSHGPGCGAAGFGGRAGRAAVSKSLKERITSIGNRIIEVGNKHHALGARLLVTCSPAAGLSPSTTLHLPEGAPPHTVACFKNGGHQCPCPLGLWLATKGPYKIQQGGTLNLQESAQQVPSSAFVLMPDRPHFRMDFLGLF